MAITFLVTTPTDNMVTATLTSDVNLLSVNPNDFTLRRADTDAVIGGINSATVRANGQSGSNWTWTIGFNNATNYAGSVYIRIRSGAFIETPGFARQPPSGSLDSSIFKFVLPTPVAPSTPTSVTATTVDHDTIRLNFGASTGTVTQYQYRQATSEAGLSSASWVNGGTATTIIVDNLPQNTRIYFQVRAGNGLLYSAASDVVSAVTGVLLVAPSTPTSLTGVALDHDTIRLILGASTGIVTTYQYRYALSETALASATWNDVGTSTTIDVDGLLPETTYYLQVRAANQTVYSAPSIIVTVKTLLDLGLVGIEAIDEQFIPVGMEDYELSIRIRGENVDVRVRGLQEGFYQTFKKLGGGVSEVKVKSDLVTRLIEKAVWLVERTNLDDNSDTFSEIIYNVVPVAPILVDPGRQTIYKGVPFRILAEVQNEPSIQRVESELVGLKSDSITENEKTYIESKGMLSLDVDLTFNTFNADYYVENIGGSDALEVPFAIRDDAVALAISGLSSSYSVREGTEFSRTFTITGNPILSVTLDEEAPYWLRVEHVSGSSYRLVGTPSGIGTVSAEITATGLGSVSRTVSFQVRAALPLPPAPVLENADPRLVYSGEVGLVWDTSSFSESELTGYVLEALDLSAGQGRSIGTYNLDSTVSSVYLSRGRTYGTISIFSNTNRLRFRLAAVNETGQGPWSNIVLGNFNL